MKGSIPKSILGACVFMAVMSGAYRSYAAHASFLTAKRDSLPSKANYLPLLVDENGEPVSGAQFRIKGNTANSTIGKKGSFSLHAKEGDVLQILLEEAIVKEFVLTNDKSPLIAINSKNPLVMRAREVRLLNNISVPPHLTASSNQSILNRDLIRMPVSSITNALTGRLAGLYTSQSSGQPGADAVNVSLRGRSPLIIIDGIPRNLTYFDLEEIESVTTLKDALSTAMLGVRGSNGALLITTRRGSENKQRISFTAQTATSRSIKMFKPLNAFDYATLYNEALKNDPVVNQGITPYSQESLNAYLTHSDPYNYPDINWLNELVQDKSRLDRYTFNATGGGKNVKYFTSFEHLNQTGFFKTSDINSYNTNNKFQSYVIRSNADLTIKHNLTAGVHLFGRIVNNNQPGRTTGTILSSLIATPSNAYPIYNEDGTYGGTQQYQDNLWAQAVGSGYRLNYRRDMMADFYLKRTLDGIAKGLWVKATAGFYANLSEDIRRDKSFAVFQKLGTSGSTYQQYGTNGAQANSNSIAFQGRSDYMELSLGYSRKLGNHGLDVLLLGNRDNSVTDDDLPYTISGTSGRIAYNYLEKYLVEFAYGLNGSNRYAPHGNRKYGFLPAIGFGWNLEKEKFASSLIWLNQLKLFTSYGKTGWDSPGNFVYNQYYSDGPGYYFGTGNGTSNVSIAEQTLANPHITFEKANKFNIGLQGAVLNNQLSWTVEHYQNQYYDLLMRRGANSGLIGNTYTNENIGKNNYSGWDFQLGWQQSKSKFNYYLNLNAGLQSNKVVFMDEPAQPYSWMYQTNQRVGATFGYKSLGLYQPGDDLAGQDAAFIEGYQPQYGDIKYADLNGDGVINYLDRTAISGSSPLLSYGIDLGFKFKWIDFNALVQGIENRYMFLTGSDEWEFQNGGVGSAYAQHLGRWTPESGTNATYPRLTLGANPNNHVTSTYWRHSGDYIRLKNIELGFTLPASLSNRARLESIRLFINGTNLFTRAEYSRVDPEVNGGVYPLQKLLNLGVNVKL